MNGTRASGAGSRRLLGWSILLLLVFPAAVGCSRKFYRRQADCEVYTAVDCAANDPRWPLEDYTIDPDPRSRMYDPCNPDFPPMPPDDPTSHRLMECVDGKRGACAWDRYGRTNHVQNPNWMAYLPLDDEGNVVLDREAAVQLSLLHSRSYQSELENLYLSALDVTFQRFRFDVQFFGNHSTFYTADGRVRAGGQSQSTLDLATGAEARRLMATGGELVVGVANSLVWQFSGPDTNNAFTLLDFSLVQPLLRAGGRAVVLEGLTDSERGLLANIRQMERYRRGFYTQVVTGRSPGSGPGTAGIALSAISGGGSTPSAGLLGILEEQVRIRNRQANVASLRDSVDRFQAFFDAGLLKNSFQVDLTRQQLLNEQSGLLSDLAAYQSRLDSYKITLGLPPDLPVQADDPLLERFDLISPAITDTQNRLNDLLSKLRLAESEHPNEPMPLDALQRLAQIATECFDHLGTVRGDMRHLGEALPARRENLRKLAARQRLRNENVEGIGDISSLNKRAAEAYHDFTHLVEQMTVTMVELEPFLQEAEADGPVKPPDGFSRDLTERVTRLSSQLLRLALLQARARLDTVYLVPIQLEAETALQIAAANRRDWMNARAALVDQWRQIQIAANDLRSDLDVTFSGDIGTVGDNPVRFRGTNGRLRVGLEFDAPLTRLVERNNYRTALINYQRTRRNYYAFEDEVNRGLRDSIRALRLGQLNFEVRRAALYVAITKVDVARLNLERSPEVGKGTSAIDTNTARDLVDALSDLLNQQNNFLSVWVDYEAQRLGLDLDLGTMQLDSRGMWIDPGEIGPDGPLSSAGTQPEPPILPDGSLPAPLEVPQANPGPPPEAPAPPPDVPAPT